MFEPQGREDARGRGPFLNRPPLLSDEQQTELEDYFSVAGQLFTARKLGSAAELYRTLFELFGGAVGEEESEEYSAYLSRGDIGINFREEWARFYRCVYETAAPEERLHSVLKAMSIEAALHPGRFVPGEEVLPLMQDVIDTLPEELPDWDEFLPEWRDALSRVSSDRAQLLLLEATSKIEGTSGVAGLAKKWGADQPRGYLFWMRRLAGSESWRELIPVGLEALDRLKPKDEFRLQVADMLIEAAENVSARETRPERLACLMSSAIRSTAVSRPFARNSTPYATSTNSIF